MLNRISGLFFLLFSLWINIFFIFPTSIQAAEEIEADEVQQTLPSGESRDILHQARRLRDLKLPEQALEKYRLLLLRQPHNAFILKEMGDAAFETGDTAKAKEYYSRALFLRPYDPNLRLAYSRSLYNHQKKEEAIQEVRRLLKEDPHFEPARKELALYLSWTGRWQEADKEFAQVLQSTPGDTSLLLDRARVLSYSGKWREAIPLYEEVVRRDPGNLDALKELALVYSWTQQWRKSQLAFEELLRKAPPTSEVIEELGNAYYFDQQYEVARRLYSGVSESNPDISRRLASRLSDFTFTMAPTLTYTFIYYRERDRRDIPDDPAYNGSTHTVSESYYHIMEYIHPITSALKWIWNTTARYDTTIYRTSMIYGTGFQVRLLPILWWNTELKWEPKNWEINPRWSFQNSINLIPADRWEFTAFHYFNTYWDGGNKSNTAGFGLSRSFFETRDMILAYRFTYDTIDDPNSYFVTIKVPDNRPDARLDLITNTFLVEKYWQFRPGWLWTNGSSYDVTTQGRNTLTLYTNLSYRVLKHLQVVGGFSGSQDNKERQTISVTGSLNIWF